MRSAVVAVLVTLTLGGCEAGSRSGSAGGSTFDTGMSTSASVAPATSAKRAVPDVRGEPARRALSDLRTAGFRRFTVTGRWSADRVGAVLSQEPISGPSSRGGTSARLVLSLGPQRRLKPPGVFVGLGTCDLGPPLHGMACAGGPVYLRP